MENPTIEEACATLIEWPNQDDFVCWNVVHSMYGGEPTDNSIELAQYWSKCNLLIKKNNG